jgi:hypothetical protein
MPNELLIKIVNAQTGEEIERPMNENELAQFELDKIEAQIKAQTAIEAEAKRQTALAKLAALGLEEDDLKALGL